MEKKRITALIIMDGYGLAVGGEGNCIGDMGGEYIKTLMSEYPSTMLEASGLAVGLPEGQMGNSEVGHLNIGAGRIVWQELTRINEKIRDKSFFDNAALKNALAHVKKYSSALHIMGLLGDGGVHSHITHLYALIELAKKDGLDKVYIHCFTDGRDVSPTSGAGFMEELKAKIDEIGAGRIATVCGRYYAMDRDNRWERLQKAYDMLTLGEGQEAGCAVDVLRKSYEKGVTDEFVLPTVIAENGKPIATVNDNDAVIFYNFRPDRAREITKAFTEENFDKFVKRASPNNIKWVCMTQYDSTFKNVEIAFLPQNLTNTLGEFLAQKGKTQLRIAETEKYAHVTFFFNGGVEEPNDKEVRILIPSPKVATYDLMPAMSAFEVREEALRQIDSGEFDVMILNFANCDMVGHTGVAGATKTAVKVVEECVESLVNHILSVGGRVLLTADHGNAEKLVDANGELFTAHTTNPVPFVLIDPDLKTVRLNKGSLCDIAPTLLKVMNLTPPKEMNGTSLIQK